MPTTNILDIPGALQIIDKASTASFQWLFVTVLGLFLGFSYLVFHHLIRQASDLAKQSREDSLAMKAVLLDMHEKSVLRSERHAAIVAENTHVISQTRPLLERINANLNKV